MMIVDTLSWMNGDRRSSGAAGSWLGGRAFGGISRFPGGGHYISSGVFAVTGGRGLTDFFMFPGGSFPGLSGMVARGFPAVFYVRGFAKLASSRFRRVLKMRYAGGAWVDYT